MNVQQYYDHALLARGYTSDDAQRAAIARLQQLYDAWLVFNSQRAKKLTQWIRRTNTPRGLYMWGGVGRGKSFLMDSFYSVVPVPRKVRVHFHAFMRDVHRQLDEIKNVANPLQEVATQIAKKYHLICFDEFHVSDIADAMILYRLLEALFERGVSFVMTSNYAPDVLYPDGLHRDRMLPAIALLKEKLDILQVDAGNDYRTRAMEKVASYYTPLDDSADEALTRAYECVAEIADEDPILLIESREIKSLRKAGGVVWFDFATLCGGPRSQYDYLEIANCFHTVILSGVPYMSAAMSSPARRFTWLIDVFYDNKIKLIMSAQVLPDQLYTTGQLANEFHRTVSRIIEMQTEQYRQLPRANSISGVM